ncbi:NTP transferase domain-containing protein [Cyclobacterium jeungdonense]|uniref:Probable molybdenum cofactor guanylyltransferase n=1 Tax=Cyclobacterium jeungdonense TaxID=708087 RepID=A0ABT8CDZ3_9BACT|nr:NTP transferase domain-containing protein [Cyclobacterium jeungdonense]MDN3689940.1 NTP transferase domain-containing protein [Cyclobacterium jeungdonense]
MTSSGKHQKHASLARPCYGDYGRVELGFLGTSCAQIQELVGKLIRNLCPDLGLVYVDADHKEGDQLKEGKGEPDSLMQTPGVIEYRDKIVFQRLDRRLEDTTVFEQREWFNRQDLILINANHFKALNQVLVIDPEKPMDKKLHKLTTVSLILMKEGVNEIPDAVKEHLGEWQSIPVLPFEEVAKITDFVSEFLISHIPRVNGLVLVGGKSTRMGQDKSDLAYHGQSQKDHMLELIKPYCQEAYLSCNPAQAKELANNYPVISDKILDMGPFGGLVSAFMEQPESAWLTVACDLPFLTKNTLSYLLSHRNPSKLATAFLDPKGEFPEPLITLWEPRAYPVLLRFLSQGYSCPRKVLINSSIELLHAPNTGEFRNINYPEAHRAALGALGTTKN